MASMATIHVMLKLECTWTMHVNVFSCTAVFLVLFNCESGPFLIHALLMTSFQDPLFAIRPLSLSFTLIPFISPTILSFHAGLHLLNSFLNICLFYFFLSFFSRAFSKFPLSVDVGEKKSLSECKVT